MEDNSFLIKTIAGALILILALNVYRTESTKKQLDHLAVTVDSLTARVGAIEYPNFSDIESDPLSGRDTKKIADLIQISVSDENRNKRAKKNERRNGTQLPNEKSAVSPAEEIERLREEMKQCAKELRFEEAAFLRDKIRELENAGK